DLGSVDELIPLVHRWIAALGEPDPARRSEGACRRDGGQVRARLWEPLAKASGNARDLFIVPDGPTLRIPSAALLAGSSGYVVEGDRTTHVLDSARELVSRSSIAGGTGLLAIGDVNYDRETPDTANAAVAVASTLRQLPAGCDSTTATKLPPLPATGG